jgi:hypothetical protein
MKTTIGVVNVRVLDHNSIGTVGVPAIRVGNLDTVGALGTEIEVADEHVGTVDNDVEPLIQIRNWFHFISTEI